MFLERRFTDVLLSWRGLNFASVRCRSLFDASLGLAAMGTSGCHLRTSNQPLAMLPPVNLHHLGKWSHHFQKRKKGALVLGDMCNRWWQRVSFSAMRRSLWQLCMLKLWTCALHSTHFVCHLQKIVLGALKFLYWKHLFAHFWCGTTNIW